MEHVLGPKNDPYGVILKVKSQQRQKLIIVVAYLLRKFFKALGLILGIKGLPLTRNAFDMNFYPPSMGFVKFSNFGSYKSFNEVLNDDYLFLALLAFDLGSHRAGFSSARKIPAEPSPSRAASSFFNAQLFLLLSLKNSSVSQIHGFPLNRKFKGQ